MKNFRNVFNFIESAEYKRAERKQKRKNARFAKLPRKQQRIAIAKDVIAMLGDKKIRPSSTYLRPMPKIDDGFYVARFANDQDTRAQHHVSQAVADKVAAADPAAVMFGMSGTACEVCGIGSLFVSAISCANNLTMKDLALNRASHDIRGKEVDYLDRWFDESQLREIEDYYEQNRGFGPIYREQSNRKRLRMIMENIISNGGQFNPRSGKHSRT